MPVNPLTSCSASWQGDWQYRAIRPERRERTMDKDQQTYSRKMMIRIQGILTIAAVLVVLFSWLMIMLRSGDGSLLQKWITVHGEHPLLAVFDLLPVWLWLFME